MNRYLLINTIKRFLLGFLLISITHDAVARCYFKSNDEQTISKTLLLKPNGAPISFNHQDILVCNKFFTGNGGIIFYSPPNPRAPGVAQTSYKDLAPTFTTAPTTITVTSESPYNVHYSKTIDLFTGDTTSSTHEIEWSWIDGHDSITFIISINTPIIEIKANQYGDKGRAYFAGGTLATFSTGNVSWANIRMLLSVRPDYSQCKAEMFTTEASPATIDFGNIDKKELKKGKRFTKEFALITHKKDEQGHCKTDITPKVTLKSNQLIDNNTIGISNGLMLQIEMPNDRNIEFNKPISFETAIAANSRTGEATQKFRAVIMKNPRKEVEIGPFHTTVIYLMEYP